MQLRYLGALQNIAGERLEHDRVPAADESDGQAEGLGAQAGCACHCGGVSGALAAAPSSRTSTVSQARDML